MPKLEVFIIHTELIKVHKSALIERGFMRNLNIIICKDAITSFKHYVLLYIQWRDVVEWEGVDEGSLGPLGVGGEGIGQGNFGKDAENICQMRYNDYRMPDDIVIYYSLATNY